MVVVYQQILPLFIQNDKMIIPHYIILTEETIYNNFVNKGTSNKGWVVNPQLQTSQG